MRIGVNPEKLKGEKNIKKQHRVIVVFHIPNITEDYYKESLKMVNLKMPLLSILKLQRID